MILHGVRTRTGLILTQNIPIINNHGKFVDVRMLNNDLCTLNSNEVKEIQHNFLEVDDEQFMLLGSYITKLGEEEKKNTLNHLLKVSQDKLNESQTCGIFGKDLRLYI